MNSCEIWRSYGTDYKNMTKRLLTSVSLGPLIPQGARIGIKPNLVTPSPASFGATTHTEIIEGLIEYLSDNGFNDITIAEGSWIGDKTAEAFEYCGYNSLAKKYGINLLDTQKDSSFEADCAGMRLNICSCVSQFDFLINVPVLKGHCQTKVTCALKNMKGLIPNSEKRRFHTLGLHRPIAHLNTGIHQDFILIDHICGDLDFEEGGHPVTRNCIMAALDPVLCDAYAASLLGYRPTDIGYIKEAEKLGVGSADLSRLKLITLEGDASADTPVKSNILEVSYAVDDADSCSACYAQLVPALDTLKEEGLLERLHEKISIGQGHKGKAGALGVGACASGFEFSIKGCPPKKEDIYRELKKYILSH